MDFYNKQLFHIYNQGNNQRQVFFSEENYLFFLWKMRAYLLPFGDLISWCLMPNHFHWQFYVKEVKLNRELFFAEVDKVELLRRLKIYGKNAYPVKRDWSRSTQASDMIDLNEAIGIIQRSYGRAINKTHGWSGRLFRDNCRAKDGWIDEFVTLKKSGRERYEFKQGAGYAYQCFCYIHDNPVKANMVKNASDYPWSSAQDYANLRKGSLCNLDFGRQILTYL